MTTEHMGGGRNPPISAPLLKNWQAASPVVALALGPRNSRPAC